MRLPSIGPTLALACALVAGAMMLPACGPQQYHAAVVVDSAVSEAIFALQDAEIAAHQNHLVSDQKHAEYKVILLKLLKGGDDLTVALQHWEPGTPAPALVATAFHDLQKLAGDVVTVSPQAGQLLAKIDQALTLLQKFGVIPSDSVVLQRVFGIVESWPPLGPRHCLDEIERIWIDLGQFDGVSIELQADGPVECPSQEREHVRRNSNLHAATGTQRPKLTSDAVDDRLFSGRALGHRHPSILHPEVASG